MLSRLLAGVLCFTLSHLAGGQPVTLPVEPVRQVWRAPEAAPEDGFPDSEDPLLPLQWGWVAVGADQIQPPPAFRLPLRPIVGIIDTGLPDHEDVAMLRGYPGIFTEVGDRHGHATHVSSILGAITNNGLGTAGTVGTWPMISSRALGDFGSGSVESVAYSMIEAMVHGARVLSISIQGPYGVPYDLAFGWAEDAGVICVVAAGNYWSGPVAWPGAHPYAITVSALDPWLSIAPYSSIGPEVDFCAPGTRIVAAWPRDGKFGTPCRECYAPLDGTSMATPMVAGIVARMLTERYLTRDQVVMALRYTCADLGPPGWDAEYGWGLVRGEVVDFVRWDRVDFDRNGVRDSRDLAIGQEYIENGDPRGDLDLDGDNDGDDLLVLISEIGP